jgi:hypothetical protein
LAAGGEDAEQPVVGAQLGQGSPLTLVGEVEEMARLLGGDQDALRRVDDDQPVTALHLLAHSLQQGGRRSRRQPWDRGAHGVDDGVGGDAATAIGDRLMCISHHWQQPARRGF